MSGNDLDLASEITLGREPDEWALARVTRSVAAVVERRGWDVDTARELLGMLGVDDAASVKKARAGLRASRIARRGIAGTQARTNHRSFKLRERPMPKTQPVQLTEASPNVSTLLKDDALFVTTGQIPILDPALLEPSRRALVVLDGWLCEERGQRIAHVDDVLSALGDGPRCRKGLHAMVGDNVIRRPDRSSGQCRECTIDRKRRDRALLAKARAEFYEQEETGESG